MRDLSAGDALLETLTHSEVTCRQVLWESIARSTKLLVQLAGREELRRRWCEIPGVGPVTAMTFMAAIDEPHRFARSKTVGAHFGLTPKREQSGTSVDRDGHISRRGDGEVRTALYEAASSMLTRSKRHSTLRSWGLRVAQKRGHKRAVVAVARKLAVIMHRMWLDGSTFRFAGEESSAADNLQARLVAA